MMLNILAVIVAGGNSSRFSGKNNKLIEPIHGWTSLELSLRAFQDHALVDAMVLVLNESLFSLMDTLSYPKVIKIVHGGKNRQESVFNGLHAISQLAELGPNCKVLVHDAARPFVSKSLIDDVIENTTENQGSVPIIPIFDAIKTITSGKMFPQEYESSWYRTQTPQGFPFSILYDCFKEASNKNFCFRDESEMLMKLHPEFSIVAVEGDFSNEKITSNNQMAMINKLMPVQPRLGLGYDFHYFIPSRTLVLGGVVIPFDEGLEGDSDGDVLTHSILEGLLGALHLGDMGRFFGLGLPELKNISSFSLIQQLYKYCKQNRIIFKISQIDATIVAQKPTLAPFVDEIIKNLAQGLNISPKNINLKATTDKGMDAAGSGKGIRCIALVGIKLLQEENDE